MKIKTLKMFVKNQPKLMSDVIQAVIYDLVIKGKLKAIDLKIIAARDCSPMPSIRKVARQLKISPAKVCRKVQHIKSLISKEL